MPDPAVPAMLREELAAAQALGLIGPRPLDEHLDHAMGFAAAAGREPGRAADLGSGGGLPSLVLAAMWPDSRWTLIDSRERAVARLEVMIARLGWADRVATWLGPAEVAARQPELRGRFEVVTARGLGPPPMVAECGAPLLAPGGRLVVSEPPGETTTDRWPVLDLARLGLRRVGSDATGHVVLEAVHPCPDRFPRRTGRPRSHPLWVIPG